LEDEMKGDDNIGDRFQEWTKYSPTKAGVGARPARRPEPFKEYPDAPRVSVALDEIPDGSLWRSLESRRSHRNFTSDPIGLPDLKRLIWAAQGGTARAGAFILRTAPSAGALYPVETYLFVNRARGIDPGIYHYNVRASALELLKKGDRGGELAEATMGQGQCRRAAAVFVFTAIVDRCKWKYAQRAFRYIYMDAGHICENVYLAAEDLGLGCCAMGAFYDDQVNALLGVDGRFESAIYLAAAGPVNEDEEE
jgi:SagB-type dehydrogenase family enzyme